MTKPIDWPTVLPNDYGIRPAGKPDECFYCHRRIGQPHKADCVTIEKLVEVEATIRYTIEVPHSWSPHDVESHHNGGSWCSNNIWRDIKRHVSRNGNCLCGDCEVRFVRAVNESPRQHIDMQPVNRIGGTDDQAN